MTKCHAHVVHMAKHMNMVGGPGPRGFLKSGAVLKSHYENQKSTPV